MHARNAQIHGKKAKYESGRDRDNIGFWSETKEYVSWGIVIERPGTYAVAVTYAHEAKGRLGEFELRIGNATLRHRVEGTGGWGTFVTRDVGTLEIRKAGPTIIAVRPISVKGPSVMNLQAIRLTEKK